MPASRRARISPNTPVEDLVSLLAHKEIDGMPAGWGRWDSAHEAHRRMARTFLENLSAYPDRFSGRGIVICAGGYRLFTCGYVCARMLRHLGCELPIQFWHFANEVDPSMTHIVAPLDVTCVNANEVDRQNEQPSRILRGYELKPFAMLHCPYREVLLLDADNVPLVDPAFLFDTPEYEQTGALFWPDYGRLERSRDIWGICEVPYRDEPEFESGQCVVDKRRCWRALNLTRHYNDHSDFYFQHIHGDKDTFHMAFRRTETPYAMPKRGIRPLDATMCQHDFQGRRIFQHRNLDKWLLDGSNRRIRGFRLESLCREFLADLRSCWSGRMFWSGPAEAVESRVHNQIKDKRFRYVRVGYDARVLEFRADGTIGEGAATCERFWMISMSDGKPVLTIYGDADVTCHLHAEDGVWKGAWISHERMPIELQPVAGDK